MKNEGLPRLPSEPSRNTFFFDIFLHGGIPNRRYKAEFAHARFGPLRKGEYSSVCAWYNVDREEVRLTIYERSPESETLLVSRTIEAREVRKEEWREFVADFFGHEGEPILFRTTEVSNRDLRKKWSWLLREGGRVIFRGEYSACRNELESKVLNLLPAYLRPEVFERYEITSVGEIPEHLGHIPLQALLAELRQRILAPIPLVGDWVVGTARAAIRDAADELEDLRLRGRRD